MSSRILWSHIALLIVITAALSLALGPHNAAAQQRGQGQPPPAEQTPRTPQASAPIDLVGLDRDGRLAFSHGHSSEGRLRQRSDQ